jgi:hypothetical protein
MRTVRHLTMQHHNLHILLAFVTPILMGCSDETLPYRLSLAEDLTKAAVWQDPNKDSIPVDMQRLHFLAGSADATADACEACLASKPPFDKELIQLITVYGHAARQCETQYRKAIEEGREELNEGEKEIADKYFQADHLLFVEILERIDYDKLAETEK